MKHRPKRQSFYQTIPDFWHDLYDSEYALFDVKKENWSYEYIIKLAKCGILKGYEDGTYKPQKSITRAEIAVVIERLYK